MESYGQENEAQCWPNEKNRASNSQIKVRKVKMNQQKSREKSIESGSVYKDDSIEFQS